MARKSRGAQLEEQIEEMLVPIADRNSVSIYDVEYVREGSDYYLRLYIDKEGGVTIDDCEAVSREMSEVLDREDPIPEAYILEVSSPGLGRTLKKDRHFEKSIGEEVEGSLFAADETGTKSFQGILESFDRDSVVIAEEGGTSRTLARKNISLIRLCVDF